MPRGLFARMADAAAAWWIERGDATYGSAEGWFADWLRGGSKSASGIAISQLRAMQEITCMACVLIRAGDLAKCPVHVYRVADDGEQVVQVNHAAERLLRQPNGWQTPLEFFESMQASLLLKSNAYAPIVRNGRGEPIAFVPVNPDRVSILESPDGDLFYQVMRGSDFERAQLAGLPERIPAADMLHLRGLSLNGVTGLSRIWMAREALGLSLAMERTAAALFGKGAHPTIVMTTDKNVTDDLAERTRARWNKRAGGFENAGEMLLLGGGVKPVNVQMNMTDAEFNANFKTEADRIAMAFEVPKKRLGLDETGDVLKSHQMYLNNTIATDAKRWESKLNQLFGLDGVTSFIEFDLDQFNLADPMTRVEMGRVAIVGGEISPNEWRRREGMGKKPGGDDLFRPMNVVPMQTPVQAKPAGAGPGSDTTGEPAPGGDGDPNGLPGKAMRNGHDASPIH